MKNKIITEEDLVGWAADAVMSQFEYSNSSNVIEFRIKPDTKDIWPSQQRMAILALNRRGGIELKDSDKEGLKLDKVCEFRAKVNSSTLTSILATSRVIESHGDKEQIELEITKDGFSFGKSKYYPRDMRTKEILYSIYRHKAKNKNGKYSFKITLTDASPMTKNQKNIIDSIYNMNKMLSKNHIPISLKVVEKSILIKQS